MCNASVTLSKRINIVVRKNDLQFDHGPTQTITQECKKAESEKRHGVEEEVNSIPREIYEEEFDKVAAIHG